MRAALVALCTLVLANVAFAQKGVYVAANVVDKWDDCPTKKPKAWDPNVFDSSFDSLSTLTEFTGKLSVKCQDSLMTLANCATDNDAFANPPGEVTSLSTSDGCCLSDCAKSIKETVALGCFDSLLTQICGNAKAAKLRAGLFNAGVRCANYDAVCPGDKPAVPKPLPRPAAPAAAANVTPAAAAGKPAGGAAAAAAKPAAGEAAAAATGAAATPGAAEKDAGASPVIQVTGGGAAAAASAAAAALAGAAALLML